MDRTFYFLALIVCIALLVTQVVAFADNALLERLEGEALKNSPILKARKIATIESEYREPQERAMPDPIVSLGFVNDGFDKYSIGERPMAKYEFGVKQTFPFPGKLELKGEIAELGTELTVYDYEQVKLKIISGVWELYYGLYEQQKKIELFKLKIDYIKALENVALELYSTGQKGINEVLSAQMQKYDTVSMVEQLRGNVRKIESALNKILGRSEYEPFPKIKTSAYHEFRYTEDELMEYVLENSKEISRLKSAIKRAQIAVDLKEKDVYPDISVQAKYSPRFSDRNRDLWGVNVSFKLPVFYEQKQKSGILEAKSSVAKLRQDFDSLSLKLKSELISNISQIETSNSLITLYKKQGILNRAKLAMDSAVTAYKNNQVHGDMVIKSINQIINYEVKNVEAVVLREKAIANIHVLTGGAVK